VVFSPVVNHSLIQILLALVAYYELELDQLDLKTVFLYSDIDKEIFMSQLAGLKIARKKNMVYKLKSLYGLK